VAEPQSGSPAAAAGLKSGDIITTVDGNEVKNPRDLARRIGALGPNKPVDLRVIRNGREETIHLRLGRLADAQAHR